MFSYQSSLISVVFSTKKNDIIAIVLNVDLTRLQKHNLREESLHTRCVVHLFCIPFVSAK